MARVLIVEDEQTERAILGYIVKRTGHEVYFASDGEQALEIYVTQSIEMVVTDLNMPHRDGLEFITVLRALFPDTPVSLCRSELAREFFAGRFASKLAPTASPRATSSSPRSAR